MTLLLTLKEVKDAARKFAKSKIAEGYTPIALHEYQDQNCKPLYWRIRLKHPKTQEKWIRPMYRNAQGEFILKEPDFVEGKPLYLLPDIVKNPESIIWITEGELCADKLCQLGLIATTSGGVDSIAKTDWSPLAKRHIIIWRDYDEAGLRYAENITQLLQTMDCIVQWADVECLGLTHKGDCVDWLILHPNTVKSEIETLPLISPVISPALPTNNPSSTIIKSPSTTILSDEPYFSVEEKGIYYHKDENKHWICSKLEIKAYARDKSSEQWGRLLEFTDADQQVHRWAMPMEMLKGSGDELRGELLRQGLHITSSTKLRHYLIEYISKTIPDERALCVNRTGWCNDNVFVLPNRTIGQSNEVIIYQAERQPKQYRTQGTLIEWQTHVAKHCVGNSRLILAVSSAFAAMLLYHAGMESGGLHFVGESSTGKTTALRVAASVYGAPDYLHRWRATTNGIEALAMLHSDSLLILDELAQVDPKEAGEIAYMLANGSGKARAAKTGAIRPLYEWRLLFLSAGEVGLAQHMSEVGKKTKAGQEVRLVDIPIDTGSGHGIFETLNGFESSTALSKALSEAASLYYGTPAITFLETITQSSNLKTISTLIRQLCKQFINKNLPANAGGQVHRVCERFALIAAAGELATLYGITGWEIDEALNAVIQCFKVWLDHRGSIGNQEHTAILKQVQAFFEAHGASRFEDMKSTPDVKIINRVGFKRLNETGETEYFVLPEMFRRELCDGFDPKLAARVLMKAGMIKASSEGKAQTPHRLSGLELKKCYHFIKTEPI